MHDDVDWSDEENWGDALYLDDQMAGVVDEYQEDDEIDVESPPGNEDFVIRRVRSVGGRFLKSRIETRRQPQPALPDEFVILGSPSTDDVAF